VELEAVIDNVMIKEVNFNGVNYPEFETEGFSAQFIFPLANKICQGIGYDIGCARLDWALPDAIPIDLVFDDEWNAFCLPETLVDYIFSSHCLEHLDDWVGALEYWTSKLKQGGNILLYLPHYDQEYWRPWNNRKHKHVLEVASITDALKRFGIHKIHSSERDINHSFVVIGEKQ